jgi:hypothetical protein
VHRAALGATGKRDVYEPFPPRLWRTLPHRPVETKRRFLGLGITGLVTSKPSAAAPPAKRREPDAQEVAIAAWAAATRAIGTR